MKKLKWSVLCLLCLLLTACGNTFAKQEYNADKRIAQIEDHYAKQCSVLNPTDDGCTFTVSKFDGRQTVWTKTLEEDRDMEIDISFHLSKGQAKIVHIDDHSNVTTIMECPPEPTADEVVTRTVSCKSGQNRFKLVGYDCEDIDLVI